MLSIISQFLQIIQNHTIHIVSFNVPYPADYGGVIDVFYRIKALKSIGVDVILHAFTYGREPARELEDVCAAVHYYRRRLNPIKMLSRRPFIVATRDSRELLGDLLRDNAPVLLEGLHCCSLLEHLPSERKVVIRAHNVEHDYYRRLADATSNPFRRLFFSLESRKLSRYEAIMTKAAAVFAVTEADAAHFRHIGCHDVVLMPSSHIDDDIAVTPSPDNFRSDGYAIYHADLSVPENVKALEFLATELFSKSPCRFIVAGRNPSPQLAARLSVLHNVTLVANPDVDSMRCLVAGAQVQVLVTDMPTGLKLKLLNSLYGGRHCLVNSNMVAGTRLGEVCTVADSGPQLLSALTRLMQTPFTQEDIAIRRSFLGDLYSNKANAHLLLEQL